MLLCRDQRKDGCNAIKSEGPGLSLRDGKMQAFIQQLQSNHGANTSTRRSSIR